MAPRSDDILTGVIRVVSPMTEDRRENSGDQKQHHNECGSSEMDHAYRAHTLRIVSVRSTVDETIQPFEKEQRMFALIRQLSRYILISG